jgi:Uma2 family endonuclease
MLENGARMTQAEFHRLYETYPDEVKFELIGGTVYMASPASYRHGRYDSKMSFVLGYYEARTPGTECALNATAILGEESEPQPDSNLRILEEYGGQSHIDKGGYLAGAAELFAEIAYSSKSIDLHAKKDDYQKAGVAEYIVVNVQDSKLHWFDFRSGGLIMPNRQGIFCSRVFPGLWIDGPALLTRNSKKLIAAVERGLASKEHEVFIKRLQAFKRKKR